jgi:amino acid transporter
LAEQGDSNESKIDPVSLNGTRIDSHIPASAKVGTQGRFHKVLGLRDLYFLCLGGSIGSAWLFGSLYGAATAGPASIVSWLIGGLIALFLAATWAEIGGILPSTGAVVKVPHYSHGYFTGFYFGWAYYLSAVIVPPVEAVAIVTYASAYMPSLMVSGHLTIIGYAVSVLIMIITFLMNYYGVRLLAMINGGITTWKICIPTITILVVLFYLYPPNFSSFGGFTPRGIGPVFSAVGTAGIVFAYSGFREALDYSGEARNPMKDVPRAMIFSVLTTVVIYTLLQTVFIGGIRWGSSGLQPGDWANLSIKGAYSSAPFYELISILGISSLATVLLFDAVVSPFGTVGVYTGSSARDLYALAEGGHLSTRMNEVHGASGVPRTALIISLFVGLFFLFAFPNWGQLATLGTTSTVFTQLAGATSLVILRRNAPELKRSFKVPAINIVAPLAFIMSGLTVYWTTWPYTGYSLTALFIGLGIFMYSNSRGAYPESDIRRGVWIVIYSIALTIISYLGSYGIKVIPLPLDFVLVGVLSIVCYYWGVRSGYKTDRLRRILAQEEIERSIDESATHHNENQNQ